jgi:hypothetical protein
MPQYALDLQEKFSGAGSVSKKIAVRICVEKRGTLAMMLP